MKGRAGRKTFWLTGLALTAVYAVICGIVAAVLALTVKTGSDGSITQFGVPAVIASIVAVAIQPVFFWTALAIAVRRCHDHDRSGLFLFLGSVPLANTWLLVEQAFVPGTTGPNQYGPDPVVRWIAPVPPPLVNHG